MYPSSASGEVGLIDTICNFTINSEKLSKQSQSESWATGIFRGWHEVKTKSLYNQSPKLFYNRKKQGWRLACNCIGGSLIPRGNVDIWVMEILMKTCWMRLLMLNVINSFCFWRETTLMINLLFSEQQFCIFVTSLHSITGICNYTFCFVIRPFTFCTRFLTFWGF